MKLCSILLKNPENRLKSALFGLFLGIFRYFLVVLGATTRGKGGPDLGKGAEPLGLVVGPKVPLEVTLVVVGATISRGNCYY